MASAPSSAVSVHELPRVPARPMLLLYGLAYALLGVNLSFLLAKGSAGLLSVALTAIGLTETLKALFARHREASWAGLGRPEDAAVELAGNLTAVQIGVILGFGIFTLRLSGEATLALFGFQFQGPLAYGIVSPPGDFGRLFGTAASAALVAAALALLLGTIYKEGGVALAVAWIGSLWGLSLVVLLRIFGPTLSGVNWVMAFLALLSGGMGFMMAGMTGLFLGRGAQRYALRSRAMTAILGTSAKLVGAAVVCSLVSAAIAASNVVG